MYKQKLNNSAVFLKKLKSQCVRYTNRLFEYLKILNSRYSEKVKNFYKLKFEAQAEKQPHVTIIKYPLPVAALLLFAVYFILGGDSKKDPVILAQEMAQERAQAAMEEGRKLEAERIAKEEEQKEQKLEQKKQKLATSKKLVRSYIINAEDDLIKHLEKSVKPDWESQGISRGSNLETVLSNYTNINQIKFPLKEGVYTKSNPAYQLSNNNDLAHVFEDLNKGETTAHILKAFTEFVASNDNDLPFELFLGTEICKPFIKKEAKANNVSFGAGGSGPFNKFFLHLWCLSKFDNLKLTQEAKDLIINTDYLKKSVNQRIIEYFVLPEPKNMKLRDAYETIYYHESGRSSGYPSKDDLVNSSIGELINEKYEELYKDPRLTQPIAEYFVNSSRNGIISATIDDYKQRYYSYLSSLTFEQAWSCYKEYFTPYSKGFNGKPYRVMATLPITQADITKYNIQNFPYSRDQEFRSDMPISSKLVKKMLSEEGKNKLIDYCSEDFKVSIKQDITKSEELGISLSERLESYLLREEYRALVEEMLSKIGPIEDAIDKLLSALSQGETGFRSFVYPDSSQQFDYDPTLSEAMNKLTKSESDLYHRAWKNKTENRSLALSTARVDEIRLIDWTDGHNAPDGYKHDGIGLKNPPSGGDIKLRGGINADMLFRKHETNMFYYNNGIEVRLPNITGKDTKFIWWENVDAALSQDESRLDSTIDYTYYYDAAENHRKLIAHWDIILRDSPEMVIGSIDAELIYNGKRFYFNTVKFDSIASNNRDSRGMGGGIGVFLPTKELNEQLFKENPADIKLLLKACRAYADMDDLVKFIN